MNPASFIADCHNLEVIYSMPLFLCHIFSILRCELFLYLSFLASFCFLLINCWENPMFHCLFLFLLVKVSNFTSKAHIYCKKNCWRYENLSGDIIF